MCFGESEGTLAVSNFIYTRDEEKMLSGEYYFVGNLRDIDFQDQDKIKQWMIDTVKSINNNEDLRRKLPFDKYSVYLDFCIDAYLRDPYDKSKCDSYEVKFQLKIMLRQESQEFMEDLIKELLKVKITKIKDEGKEND